MFRNYLITALRNFTRHKLYSFINIAGLTVGLTCAIFIILLVRDELSYDKWIPAAENLYRIEMTFHIPGPAAAAGQQHGFPHAGRDAGADTRSQGGDPSPSSSDDGDDRRPPIPR